MTRTFMLFVGLLGGCTPAARDIALSDIDLTNMQTVRTIQDRLSSQDGAAFADYAVRHHIKSANYCGQPLLNNDGEAPDTVGEAVDLTARRDAVNRPVLVAAQTPSHPRELAKEQWDKLIGNRDTIIDAQDRLRLQYGDGAKRRLDWISLETKLVEIDRKLVAMKPNVFGSVT